MRKERPFLFTDLRHKVGIEAVVDWIEKNALFRAALDCV
jgi:Ni2+-binding GTPase involved in maturation of urease and hydrogenase